MVDRVTGHAAPRDGHAPTTDHDHRGHGAEHDPEVLSSFDDSALDPAADVLPVEPFPGLVTG
ncbi:hypothetical protein LT493_18260 [Streptomyces tricolor]|nr:hypothetical protein [Streptomyces tricolor]